MCRISKHIPVYVFGAGHPSSTTINSVYLDSSDLSSYMNRLRRVEDASLLRMRWYSSDSNKIYIERKMHRESWGGEVSIKHRFACHASDVPDFLAGWSFT